MNTGPHPSDETLLALATHDRGPHVPTPDGTRSDARFDEVRRHFDTCRACSERWARLDELWSALGHSESPPRAEAMWDRIQVAVREGTEAPGPLEQPNPPNLARRHRWAWAAGWVIALGLGGMWWSQAGRPEGGARSPQGVTGTPLSALDALGSPESSVRMAAIGAIEPLLDQPSAQTALVDLLRSDPNEHVRLFALDALRELFESHALPVDLLVAALATETSPLVQTDLIVLIRRAERADPTDLRDVMDGARLHPFVLAQLSSI